MTVSWGFLTTQRKGPNKMEATKKKSEHIFGRWGSLLKRLAKAEKGEREAKAKEINIGDLVVFEYKKDICMGVVVDLKEYTFGAYVGNTYHSIAISSVGENIYEGGVAVIPGKEAKITLSKINELPNEQ